MSATSWFFLLFFLFTTQHIKIVEGIPLTAPFFVLLLPLMLVLRRASVDRQLVAIFILVAIASVYSFFLSAGAASFPSVAYLLVLMMPFVLVAREPGRNDIAVSKNFLRGFNSFMIFSVFLGLYQLALGDGFFSFRDLLPDELLLEGFNTTNQMEFNGTFIYRSNGFFFLEPSLFSQYLAFGILIEMRTTRSAAVIALMSLGMLLSLSGTGFVLLAIGLGLMAMRSGSAKDILVMVAPVVLLLAVVIYFLPTLAERVTEVNDGDSSGYWRFGMPIVVIYETYTASLHNILLGVGPGVAKGNLDTMLMAYSSGIGKILYENGVVGSFGIVALYYKFGMKSCHLRWLVLTLLVYLLIVNCGVQEPITLLTAFFLVFFASPAMRDAELARRSLLRGEHRHARRKLQRACQP